MTAPPIPTPVYRLIHIDNLGTCLRRSALCAPNHTPDDGAVYKAIHNVDIQRERRTRPLPCGPGGAIHDYVPFYFGPRSPMLLQLHTGMVAGYKEGQDPLVYLITSAQIVESSGTSFVFSDGHGIAAYTRWFDDLADLDKVDWVAVKATYWSDTADDMDRQRRKQAEFLVHVRCKWDLIQGVGVIDERAKVRVEDILAAFPPAMHRPVGIRRQWFY